MSKRRHASPNPPPRSVPPAPKPTDPVRVYDDPDNPASAKRRARYLHTGYALGWVPQDVPPETEDEQRTRVDTTWLVRPVFQVVPPSLGWRPYYSAAYWWENISGELEYGMMVMD